MNKEFRGCGSGGHQCKSESSEVGLVEVVMAEASGVKAEHIPEMAACEVICRCF